MFETNGLVAVVILIKLLVGCMTGLAIAWLVLRSRFTQRAALWTALVASIAFILATGLVGWANSHEAWLNGKRLDVAPWGEDLRWSNRIAENDALICFGVTALAAGAVALAFRKKNNKDRLNVK